jgi:hypothetical protein
MSQLRPAQPEVHAHRPGSKHSPFDEQPRLQTGFAQS